MLNWDELSEDEKLAAANVRRVRLADRRSREAVPVEHVWAPGTEGEVLEDMMVSIGRYESGRIGEVFIDYVRDEGERKKSERTINFGHDIATLISIAIQFGAPVEVLRAGMGRSEVNRMGRMVSMPHTIIGSVLDAVAAEEVG